MAVYATGDTHGGQVEGFVKLSSKNFEEGKTLTKKDYVIVLGDLGLLFNNIPSSEEVWWTKWLKQKPWTTLFVCGNHENHPRLQELPRVEMFGAMVGKVNDSLYHLRRGEIYTIEGKKFFCYGGADSSDKRTRKEGISWWPGEVPTYAEQSYALDNLEKYQYNIDYILAHTGPLEIIEVLGASLKFDISRAKHDAVSSFMTHVCKNANFEGYYCGHWHVEWYYGKYHFMYRDIKKVETNDKMGSKLLT